MKKIITFYSYKGGVGRSMALANIAIRFAQHGHKVLMVDWDLEAPGLENFFGGEYNYINVEEVKQQKGLIEILTGNETAEIRQKQWRDYVIPIQITDIKTPLHLLSAGQRNENYFDNVRKFDVDDFYKNENGGEFIENLRNDWLAEYDYVFIDSRTGVTDIGGICTIQLPDILVLLFTPTEQSFKGIIDIALRATKAQQSLPYDRQRLACLPVPTRFDALSEFKLSQKWLDIFAKDLAPIYELWLPAHVNRRRLLENTKVPYSSYFSFGEKLPVIEQGVNDPAGLGYAYEYIANLLRDDLQNVELDNNAKPQENKDIDSIVQKAISDSNQVAGKNYSVILLDYPSTLYINRFKELEKAITGTSLSNRVNITITRKSIHGDATNDNEVKYLKQITEILFNTDCILFFISRDLVASKQFQVLLNILNSDESFTKKVGIIYLDSSMGESLPHMEKYTKIITQPLMSYEIFKVTNFVKSVLEIKD